MSQAVVFDLDDTLFLEREFVLSGFTALDDWVKNKLGVPGFFDEAKASFEAGVRRQNINFALRALGIAEDEELIRRLVGIFREHKPRISLCSDAQEIVRYVRKSKRLGLITDGYLQTQQNKVEALGIGGLFDRIIFTDEGGRDMWKPHPASYSEMSCALGCSAMECVYVADNPQKDFIAPRALGWKTIRIIREGGEYSHLQVDSERDASHSIRSLRELLTLV